MERLGCPAYNLESYVDESTPIQKRLNFKLQERRPSTDELISTD